MWYSDQLGVIGRITPKGEVAEFPVPDGAEKVPFNIATGPDRNVWFTELFGNAIGRVDALPGRGHGPHAAAPQPGPRHGHPRHERPRPVLPCRAGALAGAASFCR
ncbi:hypothetical protein OG435_30675 [Streptomyces sp. NBC_01264]|nr:hypothetical protein [Streptomyces sp. NBC_01264]MCX4781086.1 hypothetical protein [Streptomyces sp. NBC_01264]